jgi:hypothetical protein
MSKPEKKTGKTPPVAAPARKPVKPERYDRRSVKEYEDEGLEQAVVYFSKIDGAFRKDTAKVEDVRSAIDRLPPDAVLQATISDFWLRLTKTEGRKRRSNSPPPSPFVKNGRNLEAEKRRIADWDVQWLAKEAARVFAKSGSSQSRSVGEMLRTRLPWLTTDNGSVIGCAGELPVVLLEQATKQPEKLGLKWMALEEALHGRWAVLEERGVWLSRFKAAARAVEAELELRYLHQAADKVERSPVKKRASRI